MIVHNNTLTPQQQAEVNVPEMKIKAIEYRAIDGFPNYRVGNDGSVWSCKVKGGNDRRAGKISSTWRRLAECPNANGYSCVNLFRDAQNFIVPVCYLILESFVGPRPEGMEACHFPDKNPRNSRLDNLRWDTPSRNQQDRKAHGTVTRLAGEANPASKLTPNDILEIVRRRKNGAAYHIIGKSFGVSANTIFGICAGKTWLHVPRESLEKIYAKR